jgi:hypothetical protein
MGDWTALHARESDRYRMRILKVLRSAAGAVIMLSAVPFLIQGGLSRYAKYGIPRSPDWRLMVVGLVMLAIGGVLIRPLPRSLHRRPRPRLGK